MVSPVSQPWRINSRDSDMLPIRTCFYRTGESPVFLEEATRWSQSVAYFHLGSRIPTLSATPGSLVLTGYHIDRPLASLDTLSSSRSSNPRLQDSYRPINRPEDMSRRASKEWQTLLNDWGLYPQDTKSGIKTNINGGSGEDGGDGHLIRIVPRSQPVIT